MSHRQTRLDLLRIVGLRSPSTFKEYIAWVRAANDNWRSHTPDHWLMYLRDVETRKPYGCLIIHEEVNDVYVTGSICHPNERWDKHLAFFHAISREHHALIDVGSGCFEKHYLPYRCRLPAHSFVSKYLVNRVAKMSA